MRNLPCWSGAALLLACASTPTTREPGPPPPATLGTAAANVTADAGATDATALFRLPPDVHPRIERVSMEIVPEREDFRGEVEIELTLEAPRQDLWISARRLTFQQTSVRTGSTDVPAIVQPHDSQGVARVVPASAIPAGPATLRV